jgi:group I intron endonuclease
MPRANIVWNRSGIYKIVNTVTGDCYVGSAVNIGDRKLKHFHQLRHNKHHSKYLQRSFNVHGEAAFVFSIIEELPRDAEYGNQFRYETL